MQRLILFFLVLCTAICPLLAQNTSLYPADRVAKAKEWMYGGIVTVGFGSMETRSLSSVMAVTAMADAVVRNSVTHTVHTCYMLTLQHATGVTDNLDFTAQTIRLQFGQLHEARLGKPMAVHIMWALGLGIPVGGSLSGGTVTETDRNPSVAVTLAVGLDVEVAGVQVRPQLGLVADYSSYRIYYTSNGSSNSVTANSSYPMFSVMVVL